jgi:hypothetical protein
MIIPSHPGRGRGSHRTLDEATTLVSQWQASGLSKQAWCNEQGILPTALISCLHRIKRQVIAPSPVRHPFIEIRRCPPVTIAPRLVRLTLAGSVATAEMTVNELGALIQHLSGARS